ncbi:helix-turn-helix domain-containing protein [Paenibacillus sp. NPDC058071]|uniref:helix-turn-helix domain-containing protein n=1 Tax=Paenibacillus sp. NPDC058071 TaxID=3346326 RepID=UPI0036DEE7AE
MNSAGSEWVESYFPLYNCAGVHSYYGSAALPEYKENDELTALIVVAQGKGILRVNDQSFELKQGNVLLMPAHHIAALVTNRLHLLHVYLLLIQASQPPVPEQGEVFQRQSAIVSRPEFIFHANEPELVAKAEQLYMHRSPVHEIRHAKNQLLFQEMMFRLLELQEAKYESSGQPSMERSIDFLETHFSEKITREQLAAIAGISRSHYSILFKQVTGFSPSDYLSRLRVHRAMELLIDGFGTLREIALKVGYKDEFYLSRRFKQQAGAAPSAYMSEDNRRIAVLLPPFTSHLLLLGIEPQVAIADSSEYARTSELQVPQSMVLVDEECTADQLKSILLENSIELIIASRAVLNQSGLSPEQLRLAAPVIDISWMEMGWKEHFRLIANAVQRSEAAERWLTAFEQEEHAGRLLLKHTSLMEETVSIVVLKPDELLIYGARNAGYVIYKSLGLQPPARIRQKLEKHGECFHSFSIPISELPEYAGDRLLVILFADRLGSTAHAERLFQSAVWQQLPAVLHQKVHMLDQNDWIPYNPVSVQLQLQRAIALLTETSGNQ